MVEAAVIGEQVFLDEFFSGLFNFGLVQLEIGLDFGVAVITRALSVGDETEEEVEEFGIVVEAFEEAVFEQPKGDPCEGFFDGSDSVWA